MTIWFHQNMTSLYKMWWIVHKFTFGIRNYQVSKHVVSVLSNIWPSSLLYTNQVLMFLLSTARRVGGNRSKERDRKSELVLRSTYQIFEWD